MTKSQYHGLISPIWLVACHTTTEPWFAVACAFLFAAHGVTALVHGFLEARHA